MHPARTGLGALDLKGGLSSVEISYFCLIISGIFIAGVSILEFWIRNPKNLFCYVD